MVALSIKEDPLDIRVIQRDSKTGKITFSMTSRPQKISGLDKLVQTFVLALFNSPGRDALTPNNGGGLEDLIGQFNYNQDSLSSVMDEVYQRLDKTASEVKQAQTGLLNEDPNAMLNTYRVTDFQEKELGGVGLKLRLVSMAGSSIDITV
jgi:hypothetical protein